MKILVLNSGSSTQKTALFDIESAASSEPVAPLWEGKLEWDGEKENLTVRNGRGKQVREEKVCKLKDRASSSVEKMVQMVWSGPAAVLSGANEVDMVGHRIVHGGAKLEEPVVIDGQVKQDIAEVAEIAPLHNKAGLEGIETAGKLFPGKKQIAVFDTGFHRTMADYAFTYPGRYEWLERGIRRYGFHGINHQYCGHRAAHMLQREVDSVKVVSCHLGNGCSLAAIDGGKSVNTTMGFTPLDGVMMGTRGGEIDPGILVHLMRKDGCGANELDDLLNRHSGLLGISGVSSDMRDVVEASSKGNKRAKLAFEIFVHRLRTAIAAMAASMGGIDALVFTAGIGENSVEVRRAACEKLSFLGVQIDSAKNGAAKPDADIATPESRVRVLVIRAQEDWSIARECVRLKLNQNVQNSRD
ncbi:MAG TPA: acetate kinase [Terriglobales bacterium]|nr:acetate kinase [Terriglobales bacterium]